MFSVKMEFYENLMRFYENLIDFYRFQAISIFLWFRGRLLTGETGKLRQGPSDLVGGGRPFMNPVLASLHPIYMAL